MKRALGAVTTWDTFKRMTEGNTGAHDFPNPVATSVHVAPHVREAARQTTPEIHGSNYKEHATGLPHSHESAKAHHTAHGSTEQVKVHHTPE